MTAAALAQFCLALKGTTQDIKWENNLCYLVGGKMYCTTAIEGSPFTSFKVTPEDFAELTQRVGIIPAPYLARNHLDPVTTSGCLVCARMEITGETVL